MDDTDIKLILLEIDQLENDLMLLKDREHIDWIVVSEKMSSLRSLREELQKAVPIKADNVMYVNFATKRQMDDTEATSVFKTAMGDRAMQLELQRVSAFLYPDMDTRLAMHTDVIRKHFTDLFMINKSSAIALLRELAKS